MRRSTLAGKQHETAVETKTSFTNIDNMMATARAKYATNAHLVPKVRPHAYVPLSEDAESDERIGLAVSRSRGMIAEAKAHLAAPPVAPEHLTVEELDDQADWQQWDDGLRMATECNHRWLADNQTLFDEVIDAIPEPDSDWDMLLDGVKVPDAPLLRSLEALERISAGAKCWIAISKAISREHMVREAALKPVLIIKPAHGTMENGEKEGGGVGKFFKRVLSVKKR